MKPANQRTLFRFIAWYGVVATPVLLWRLALHAWRGELSMAWIAYAATLYLVTLALCVNLLRKNR